MKKASSSDASYRPVWFIETKRFTTRWDDLRLTVDDLIELQNRISMDPTANPVIANTGGLRKMRFASSSIGNKGKRGSLRVCYAYFPRYSAIVLVMVYLKSEMDDLSPESKKIVKDWLKKSEAELKNQVEKKQSNGQ